MFITNVLLTGKVLNLGDQKPMKMETVIPHVKDTISIQLLSITNVLLTGKVLNLGDQKPVKMETVIPHVKGTISIQLLYNQTNNHF